MGQKISKIKAIDEILGTKKENLALRRYFYSKNKKIDKSTDLSDFTGEITNNDNNNDKNNNENSNDNNNINSNDNNNNDNDNDDDDNNNNNKNHSHDSNYKKNEKEKNSFRSRSIVNASSLIHPLSVYRSDLIRMMLKVELLDLYPHL